VPLAFAEATQVKGVGVSSGAAFTAAADMDARQDSPLAPWQSFRPMVALEIAG
jgi:hypothetical protein